MGESLAVRFRVGVEVEGINYDEITITHYLDQIGARPAAPYSQEALRHESGIHLNSLLQDIIPDPVAIAAGDPQ